MIEVLSLFPLTEALNELLNNYVLLCELYYFLANRTLIALLLPFKEAFLTVCVQARHNSCRSFHLLPADNALKLARGCLSRCSFLFHLRIDLVFLLFNEERKFFYLFSERDYFIFLLLFFLFYSRLIIRLSIKTIELV